MAELETKVEATEVESTPKTFTQEEVDELLQKETDRRVTSALKKAEEKNAEKIKEAQKLAEMDAALKFQYELEQREKAIAAKEKALKIAENTNSASKQLSEKGLSLDLVQFVVSEDIDVMDDKIKKLEIAFKNSVKSEIEKRLSNNTPKLVVVDNTPSIKKISEYSPEELQKLKMTNPEIFEKLKN